MSSLGGKTTSEGSTTQGQSRSAAPNQRPMFDVLTRALMGQLSDAPETPISVPLQQAISNAQGGLPYMRNQLGMGGGLVNQLTGQGVGGGTMLPPELQAQMRGGNPAQYQQTGLQSRQSLGLPDRNENMDRAGFIPTPEELQALGAVPAIHPSPSGRKAQKNIGRLESRAERLTERIDRRQEAGKKTGKAEQRLANTQARLGAARGAAG